MDKQRAKEIAASPVMANVTYEETPIYIQSINDKSGTAIIYPLGQPDNEMEVDLNGLIEHR